MPDIPPGLKIGGSGGPGGGGGGSSFSTAPVIVLIDPTSARTEGGTPVTITGYEFINNSDGTPPQVFFGTDEATNVVVVDRNTITCETPETEQIGLVDVTIITSGGTYVLPQAFQFYNATIVRVTPPYGLVTGGIEVLIEGFNFLDNSTITFGGVAVTSATFIDSENYLVTIAPHEKGWVNIVMEDTAGATAVLYNGFQYTLLTRGDDIRRSPGIIIRDVLNNQPNSCTFTVDGSSNIPIIGEEIEITDSQDSDRRLFAGTVQAIEQAYEGLTNQLVYNTSCVDFTFLMNKYRPFGKFEDISASDVVKALIATFAPDFTTAHVQTRLAKVSVELDGTKDMSTCLNEIAAAIGSGHWFVDYDRDVHFFHIVPDDITIPSLPQAPQGSTFGTAMTVAQGDGIPSSFSYKPGYYRFAATAIYNNDVQSKLSPWSNWVYLDGHHKIEFSDLPIFNDVNASITVRHRFIYCNKLMSMYYPGGGGLNKTSSMKKLERFCALDSNNVTTSFSIWFGQGWDTDGVSGQPIGVSPSGIGLVNIPGTWKLPIMPYLGHPAAPTAAPNGTVITDSGPSNRGQYSYHGSARYAFYYEDGSISYAGPPSATYSHNIPIQSSFGTLVRYVQLSGIQVGPDVNGIPCIARLVYCTAGTGGSIGSWGQVQAVNGVAIIPNNVDTSFNLNPPAQLDYNYSGDEVYGPHGAYLEETTQPYYPSTSTEEEEELEPDPVPVWPNPDGPWLEDDFTPGDIDENNMDLLRDPQITVSTDLSQIRNRIFVVGRGTSLTADITIGDSRIPVADPNAFSLGGGRIILRGEKYLYSGVTGSTGAWYLELLEPMRTEALSGEALNNYMQVDDFDSQKQLANAELLSDGTKSDGVHEGMIIDGSLKTTFQLYMRGSAELEIFGRPIVTVTYATRDPLTRSGRFVNINLTNPPIQGEFLIQDVTIDQIHDDADALMPRYTVSASSVKFELTDLLLQMIGGTKIVGGSAVGIATAATTSAATAASPDEVLNRINHWMGRQWVALVQAPNNTVQGYGYAAGGASGAFGGSVLDDTQDDGPWGIYGSSAGTGTAFLRYGTSGQNFRFGRDWQFDVLIKTGDVITQTRVWAACVHQQNAVVAGAADIPTQICVGFRYSTAAGDVGWKGFIYNGSTMNLIPAAPTAAINTYQPLTVYKLRVRRDSTGVYFSVNQGAEYMLSTALLPVGTTNVRGSTLFEQTSISGTKEMYFRAGLIHYGYEFAWEA